ncbi:NADH kinase pos5 [Pleosporales sp. CAS-2024a]
MVLPWRLCACATPRRARSFSASAARRDIRHVRELPARLRPAFQQSPANPLLNLQWPSPPRNILITKKQRTPNISQSLVAFATHIRATYPAINIILEPDAAAELHQHLAFPVYSYDSASALGTSRPLSDKTDLICTLGGDGTVLRASSLFSHADSVPPVLSFAMGTIGFLGEWKFKEYKRAFREVYMSGAPHTYSTLSDSLGPPAPRTPANSLQDPLDRPLSYADIRGKAMGTTRTARVLLRNRLKVGVFAPDGSRIGSHADTYALNEVTLHRGSSPHLKIIDVYISNRFLTEAVADGMIISSPTGSTAYSLSSGGSIVHPLVPSLLLTPICPRSLSFRPLVLPAETPITLSLGKDKNRGHEVEVSIDGQTITQGMGEGMEVRVAGEDVRKANGEWDGGVPSIVRGTAGNGDDTEDHWVGGLNALLKFNYPFGDQDG